MTKTARRLTWALEALWKRSDLRRSQTPEAGQLIGSIKW
jgi:hypothetical protein